MSSLSSEGIKCPECVLAVVLNSAAEICNKEHGDSCEKFKNLATEGELSVGEYLKKMKEQCKTDEGKFQIDELKEFYREENES